MHVMVIDTDPISIQAAYVCVRSPILIIRSEPIQMCLRQTSCPSAEHKQPYGTSLVACNISLRFFRIITCAIQILLSRSRAFAILLPAVANPITNSSTHHGRLSDDVHLL